MLKKLKKWIRALFEPTKPTVYRIPRFIGTDSVLQFLPEKNGWYIGKRRLTPEDRAALRLEAKGFAGSFLWKMMRNDIHYLAYLQATAKRHTEADALYAGAMYRDLEVLEEFMKQCEKL